MKTTTIGVILVSMMMMGQCFGNEAVWKIESSGVQTTLSNDKQNFDMMLKFMAPDANKALDETVSDQAPVNLMLVLDGSGSMQGEISSVVTATQFVIENMRNKDRLGMVFFDSGNFGELEPILMNDAGKQAALRYLNNHYGARGATNLFGGLKRGIELFRKHELHGNVILFTDGQANVGVTQTPHILQKLQEMENSHSIFTMGFGAGVESSMLTSLAEASGGVYYYLKDSNSISQLMADCLGNIFQMSASDIRVEFVGENGFKFVGFGNQIGETSTRLPDFVNGEQKKLLIELEAPLRFVETKSADVVGTLVVRWRDSSGKENKEEITLKQNRAPAHLIEESEKIENNHDLSQEKLRLEVLRDIQQAQHFAEKGDEKASVSTLASIVTRIGSNNDATMVALKGQVERLEQEVKTQGGRASSVKMGQTYSSLQAERANMEMDDESAEMYARNDAAKQMQKKAKAYVSKH